MPAPDLNADPTDWLQIQLHFNNWASATTTAATHLLPVLETATSPGGTWWFIRKHPHWRVRLQPGTHDRTGLRARLEQALDGLTDEGILRGWSTGHYEPETTAFGGPEAMAAAHTLFAADSQALLRPAPDPLLGPRELSMLCCGALLRGARLEPYEIGDVWAKVTHDRPLPLDATPARLDTVITAIQAILRTDCTPDGNAFGDRQPLAYAHGQAQAFHTCGNTLTRLAHSGLLQRGLRSILAYHVIFHWNRAGLHTSQQTLLAHAARHAILGAPTPADSTSTRRKNPSRRPTPNIDIDHATSHFPLLPPSRPSCPPLPERLQTIRNHAHAATTSDDPDERVDRACSAWNLTALIAADGGLPGLAADLCHQQFELLHTARPLPPRIAIAALQPLINLARLHERGNHPEAMYRLLTGIEHGLEHDGAPPIQDTTITLDGLTTPHDTEPVRAWYRTVLLRDGTRALAATGEWTRAAAHAVLHDPTPERLQAARQTRIIALATAGNHTDALAVLDNTDPADHDTPIAAALRAIVNAAAGHPHHDELSKLVAQLSNTTTGRGDKPGEATLHSVRLAHIADDLGAGPNRMAPLWTRLARQILETSDAYAAQAALTTRTCRATLTPTHVTALDNLVCHAGISGPPLRTLDAVAALTSSLKTAAAVLMGCGTS
ncbi:thiopeptide-type bacteriocin biosynthesis protein [Embleya sp. NPDC008237]|uniref:thiopeptide-type bacteriocin biosynthesis protein n=1 Tax=Embleya sp. NPDC008237 TaxID=3363978 RepID=UPI0036E019D1